MSFSLLAYNLKKIVGGCLMPLPLCLILMAIGLFLSRRGKQSRCGRWIILASFAWLLLASSMTVNRLILYPLEHRYSPIPEITSSADIPADLAGCTAIVVLGSGHSDDPSYAASTKLCEAALSRIVEGVRIARALPHATLITSGASDTAFSHALALSLSAQSMGIDAKRIQCIDQPSIHDTHDEAQAAAKLVKHGKIALVTSASHMPRAVALFRKEGLQVVPCPTDFKCKDPLRFRLGENLWDSESLSRTTMAVHEYLGYAWAKLRGQI